MCLEPLRCGSFGPDAPSKCYDARVTKVCGLFCLLTLVSCSSAPKKPVIPSLTPEEASQLLHYNPQAQTWLVHVQKQNPGCDYRLDLPDQTTHPTELDLDHVVYCGNQPAPLELSASVVFVYDPDKQQWVLKRFSS